MRSNIKDKELLMRMLNNYFNYNDNVIPMYPWSNENLDELFKKIDVKDKKVLSVMASGDQPLLAYLNGAETIDTFDRNYCTLYHFFLRKWIIENTSKRIFERFDEKFIKKVLDLAKPNSDIEESALIFWKILYNSNFKENNYELNSLIFDKPIRTNDYLLPYATRIKEEINNIEFNFYNIDLFKNIDIENSYDVIILSNILECATNIEELKNARHNILRLLNPNGVAVCSYKKNSMRSESHKYEKSILSIKYYSYYLKPEEFGIKTQDEYGFNDLGYQYRKLKM